MGGGEYIQSRQNVDLFTVARFIQSKVKKQKYTSGTTGFFSVDSALIAHSAEEIQSIVHTVVTASSKFDMKIIMKKTEVMFQPNSSMTMEEDIKVDEITLNPVQEFTYLGSVITSDGHIEAT